MTPPTWPGASNNQPPQRPQQPQQPQQPPQGPQLYRRGGKVLAVLAAVYFIAWWFAVLGEMGNAAIFGISITVLTVLCYGLFAVDWRGYTSLNGLIKWNQMQTSKKAGMGCLFFILLPFMPLVYFVRAIQQHNAATQQTINTRLQSAWQGFKTSSRKNQAVISAVLAVAVLAFCSLSSAAASGGNGLGTSTPPVNQVAGTGGSVATSTSQPTATRVPTATPTRVPPTATSVPPTPTSVPPTAVPPTAVPPTAIPAPAQPTCDTGGAPSNPWCYTFANTGKLIYSPPSNFCGYFNCIPSFWQSTNGYVDECVDGTYSHSGGVQGACSHHQGEKRPLYQP